MLTQAHSAAAKRLRARVCQAEVCGRPNGKRAGGSVRAWALVLGLLLAVACRERAKGAPTGDQAEPANGASARVVSLHDVTTEIVVALGATARLVGIAELVDAPAALREAVVTLPRAASLESILMLKPSVVLGLAVVAERDPELVRELRERGIDVHLGDPASLDDVYRLTAAIAERTGAIAEAERLVASLRARVAGAGPSEDGAGAARPLRVFVYDCCDPPFTAGGKTVLTELIERAGGHNIFSDLDADWTHVSWEAVVARRPEVLVVHAYSYEGQGDVPEKLGKLRTVPSLAELPSVIVPLGESLGGLRSIDGFERLQREFRLRHASRLQHSSGLQRREKDPT